MGRGTYYAVGQTVLESRLTQSRADLLDRLAIILAGGAGELTPARAALLANLPNLDAAVSSRALRQATATYDGSVSGISGLAASQVMLDSGQLPAGDYAILAILSAFWSTDITGACLVNLEHRNAANAANVASWDALRPYPIGGHLGRQIWIPRRTVALNERFRWVEANAQALGGTHRISAYIFIFAV